MFPVLKLDITGTPMAWIAWHTAANLYARGRVRWSAGDTDFTIRGGFRNGEQTTLKVNSIIATDERRNTLRSRVGPGSNRDLFSRDGFICLYCGVRHSASNLTRDHVRPSSRGGDSSWENLATACRNCNMRKNDRSPEEASMPLLALPYRPDPGKLLLLMASGRKITACQQAWLEAATSKESRRH